MKVLHIFRHRIYIVYAIGIVFGIITTVPLFANRSFVIDLVGNNTMTFGEKLMIFVSIPYGYMGEGGVEPIILLVFAILSGINFSGIVYYVSRNRAAQVSILSALGSGSIVSAVIGLGCLSCGSLIVAFIASVLGVSSLVIFPYNGLEFGILSIIVVSVSIYILNKKLS